jgi:hypothetical protein
MPNRAGEPAGAHAEEGFGMWFSAGGQRVRDSIEAGASWCERFFVVSALPAALEPEDELWAALTAQAHKAERVILELRVGGASPPSSVVAPFAERGALRRVVDDAAPRANLLWFERGEEVRVFVACEPLSARAALGHALWFVWEGVRGELPDGLATVLEVCCAASLPVRADELPALFVRDEELAANEPKAPSIAPPPAYSRPILSVREVLGIRSTRDFFELEAEEQEQALWSTLLGEGALDLEQAIRFAAERLRAQGFLDYQVLRADGRVRTALEERLLAARRSTDLFDRPRNGFVRAIQVNLDELSAEQWRDAVIRALEPGVRVDRESAVRAGFAFAQKMYGVDAQRLRTGGRADQALRSAINSAVRQGWLARDGAAYLVRVAADAPPTLRGTLEPDAAPDEVGVSTPPAQAEPSAAAPERAVRAEMQLAEPGLEASASARPAPQHEARDPLAENLWALDFPTRTLNWSLRAGVETLRDLIMVAPDLFTNERNVGRRTVRETRERIQALLGQSWEEARAALQGGAPVVSPIEGENDEEAVDSATEALTAGGATGFAQMASRLSDAERRILLCDVALPTRMRNYVRAEGLERVGDLMARPYAALSSEPNMGRKSLNDTLDAIRDHLAELESPADYTTFLKAWHAQLGALEPIPRMVATRRAGMLGTRETLEEVAVMLGVTRERVRQIELRVVERLRERPRFRQAIEAKLADSFGSARAVPVELMAEDPFWAGIGDKPLLLDYLVRRVLDGDVCVIEGPSGKRYLTRFVQGELEERIENAKRRVAKLEYPVELSVIDEIVRSESDALDPVLASEIERVVSELLHVDPEAPLRATGYGRRHHDEVLAFLNRQDQPVPIALVEAQCGRGHLPEEVLYFKRGVVGLERHFPDFRMWQERLVPRALEVMRERPAGRQWLVPEVHALLEERGLVPDWLGHWHLASLLRLSGEVSYLGRLRVALKGSGQDQRLEYEDVLVEALEQAGTPLAFDELLRRVRERTAISEGAATIMVGAAPFVRLDEERVGLVERDIPGGPEAVASAIEAVIARLTETAHGLTPHQASELVERLSPVHADWSRPLVVSVLRSEASLRIDRSKNIGLEEWDDARCPARAEFVRLEVLRSGGALPVAEVLARLEAIYGRAPDRGSLHALAGEAGLVLEGDRVMRPRTIAPEAPAPGVALNLGGIPAELRQMFEELVRQPLTDVAELESAILEHVAAIDEEHHVNEFVDREGAHLLGAQCRLLLAHWENLPPPDRHLAHAAIRYFVSWHDLEHDLDIGGLDDDKQIMNTVLAHLGLSEAPLEVRDGALAS